MDNSVYVEQIIGQLSGAYTDGQHDAERRLFPALRALETQYIRAQATADARLPTSLELAIVQVLALLPRP